MKISDKPTNILLVHANTTAEYDSAELAVINIDKTLIKDVHERICAVKSMVHQDSFAGITFWDGRVTFKNWNESVVDDNPEFIERFEHVTQAFIELEEGETIEDFTEDVGQRLDTFMMKINKDQGIWFVCHGKDSGDEFYTDSFTLIQEPEKIES